MKRLMGWIFLIFLVIFLFPGCGAEPKPQEDDFIRGMDVSSLLSQLYSGVTYYDYAGNPLDGPGFMRLLADSGVNWVRLRVWNDPYDAQGNGYGGGNCDLNAALTMGKWASDAGLRVLIDFHYSDFWADPSRQAAPKAWEGLSLEEKVAALEEYTRSSLTRLLDAGVDVGMVQLGNEINYGLAGETDWSARCQLLNAGSRAVRSVDPRIPIALHFTDPQRPGQLMDCAGILAQHQVDYDIFATSYYAFWHGTTDNLTAVLRQVSETYEKKVCVMETSWAYTLSDGDGHGNTVSTASGPYPISPQGQMDAVADVVRAVGAVGENGIGVFYWEPAWIPVGVYDGTAASWQRNAALWEAQGSGWASSYAGSYDPQNAGLWYGGSSWDNQALFDFRGHPLESLKMFEEIA